jgi:hypothetical protein
MHTRRLVAFILGVWLGGMLFIAYTTSSNSSITTGILDNPPEGQRALIELSGKDRVTTLLRFNTAELNRALIESWEFVQLGLGLAVVCALPFALRLKWLHLMAAGAMFAIVIAQRTLLTPEMIGLGRMLDLAGGTAATQDALWRERHSLHTLQQLYIALDVAKVILGFGLTAALLIFRQKISFKRGKRLEKLDLVDDSDYGHIDGRVGTSDGGHG